MPSKIVRAKDFCQTIGFSYKALRGLANKGVVKTFAIVGKIGYMDAYEMTDLIPVKNPDEVVANALKEMAERRGK